jgi:chaperonin GroEL (HSP60 family)
VLTKKQTPGVVFQPQVYNALQQGINKMVGAIRPTLGPVSGGVLIDHVNKAETLPEYLDDGGLIARRIIELPDRNEDMGAMLARSMIARQHEEVGDGTATAAVLLAAIFDAGIRYIAAGGNAMQLRRQLEATIPLIFETLDGMVTTIEGQPALTRMAYTLCHDETMAQLLGGLLILSAIMVDWKSRRLRARVKARICRRDLLRIGPDFANHTAG